MDAVDPLTCERLAELLESEGYRPDSYGIGRHGKYRDQAFILDRWSKRWVVYYTERGEKTHIRKYASEDAACRDLLSRLRGQNLALPIVFRRSSRVSALLLRACMYASAVWRVPAE
jgi:hypothetical protein